MTCTFWVQRVTTWFKLLATARKAPSTNRLTAMVPTERALMRRLRHRLVRASWKKERRARSRDMVEIGAADYPARAPDAPFPTPGGVTVLGTPWSGEYNPHSCPSRPGSRA